MRCGLFSWTFVALVTSCFSVAKATTVISDTAADFSTTVNTDTSTWSYRCKIGTTRDGNYPLFPSYGPANGNWSPANPGAWNLGSASLPEIGVNRTGQTVSNLTTTPGDNFSLANGTFFMRPQAGDLVVLSWLYPFNSPQGVIINAVLTGIDHGGNGSTVYEEIRRSDNTLRASGSAGGSSGGVSHFGDGVTAITMFPGERFDLILDSAPPFPPMTEDDAHDAMSVSFTISVPEPSKLTLLALGAVGLAVTRRRALSSFLR
jgi:hypothetical protein